MSQVTLLASIKQLSTSQTGISCGQVITDIAGCAVGAGSALGAVVGAEVAGAA